VAIIVVKTLAKGAHGVSEARPLDPLRQAVREVAQRFPSAYWRELEQQRAYPEAFVTAMVDSPVGMQRALLPPVTMEGVEPRMDRIPEVGEQTEKILGWLGYDAEQRAALRAASAI